SFNPVFAGPQESAGRWPQRPELASGRLNIMSPKVIVALDVDTREEALALVDALGASADHYKIGIQTLAAAGPQLARALIDQGKHVFLDLKLHEIPASVAGAVRVA